MIERPSAAAATCAVLWLLTATPGAAQHAPELSQVNLPLAAWVASRPHAPPDTLATFETSADRMTQFRALLDSLAAQNWQQAAAQAQAMAYALVTIREGGSTFVAASDNSGAGRDPTIIINLKPQRDFIVGAPHMPFEKGTGEQAAIFLKELGGRAAIISGAHRCASRTFTTCDGTTAVCGGTLQGYRDSDVSHNVETLYHAAHVLMAERWPASVVISLHGMKEDTDGVRTSVIISSGIRAEDTGQKTVATKLRSTLSHWIKQPGAVASCNLPADANFNFRKLCGYTNVQGRHVNGDSDACRVSVEQGTGRFIHMEQDWTVLKPYAESSSQLGRHPYNAAFVGALAKVLPAADKQ